MQIMGSLGEPVDYPPANILKEKPGQSTPNALQHSALTGQLEQLLNYFATAPHVRALERTLIRWEFITQMLDFARAT